VCTVETTDLTVGGVLGQLDGSRLRAIRHQQVERARAEDLGEFVEGHDSRVATALFEAAEILLAEPGALRDLLLGQAPLAAQAGKVPADDVRSRTEADALA